MYTDKGIHNNWDVSQSTLSLDTRASSIYRSLSRKSTCWENSQHA